MPGFVFESSAHAARQYRSVGFAAANGTRRTTDPGPNGTGHIPGELSDGLSSSPATTVGASSRRRLGQHASETVVLAARWRRAPTAARSGVGQFTPTSSGVFGTKAL